VGLTVQYHNSHTAGNHRVQRRANLIICVYCVKIRKNLCNKKNSVNGEKIIIVYAKTTRC
jgi:hypothetical protein